MDGLDMSGAGTLQRGERLVAPEFDGHYWLGEHLKACASGPILERQDFSVANFRSDIIPHLIKWEPVGGLPEIESFRYRVMGQGIVDFVGADLTGKYLSDLPFLVCRKYMKALGTQCLIEQKPIFSRTDLMFKDHMLVTTEKSFYPVRQGDRTNLLILFTFINYTYVLDKLIDGGEPVSADDNYWVLPAIGDWGVVESEEPSQSAH